MRGLSIPSSTFLAQPLNGATDGFGQAVETILVPFHVSFSRRFWVLTVSRIGSANSGEVSKKEAMCGAMCKSRFGLQVARRMDFLSRILATNATGSSRSPREPAPARGGPSRRRVGSSSAIFAPPYRSLGSPTTATTSSNPIPGDNA